MGIDIYGWVEVSRFDAEERGEEHTWQAVISIAPIVDTCDEVSQLLFGFSKHALGGGQLPYVPIASNRGIPSNPSDDVERDLESIQAHELQFGPGEFSGFTHIDLDEINLIDWQSHDVQNPESSDWWLLFRMIQRMRTNRRFANAGFRIVCWVSW